MDRVGTLQNLQNHRGRRLDHRPDRHHHACAYLKMVEEDHHPNHRYWDHYCCHLGPHLGHHFGHHFGHHLLGCPNLCSHLVLNFDPNFWMILHPATPHLTNPQYWFLAFWHHQFSLAIHKLVVHFLNVNIIACQFSLIYF